MGPYWFQPRMEMSIAAMSHHLEVASLFLLTNSTLGIFYKLPVMQVRILEQYLLLMEQSGSSSMTRRRIGEIARKFAELPSCVDISLQGLTHELDEATSDFVLLLSS
mmetsp:Transcript_7364/g.11776  ORF Transcript_7364/g.11776 Transcript_7364/m.11776 type:complete len:107 (+) Transcript_7364:883-1203(+)